MRRALVPLLVLGCGPRSPSEVPGERQMVAPPAARAVSLGAPELYGAPMPIHLRPIIGLATDPAGGIAISASRPPDEYDRAERGAAGEPGVHIWELATGQLRRRLGDFDVHAMAATADASVVAALDPAGTVHAWSVADGAARGRVVVGPDVRWIGLGGDARLLYTVDRKGRAVSWELATGAQIHAVESKIEPSAVDGTPGGVIAVGGERGLALVDLAAKQVRGLGANVERISALDFSADGKRLAAAESHAGRLWDVATGKETGSFQGGAHALLLTGDGRSVVASAPHQGQQLAVIDLAARGARVLDGWSGHALALAELPGGRLLAGTFDGPIRTFDLDAGKDVRADRGHVAAIQVLIFTADGALIASSGMFTPERTLRWRTAAARPEPLDVVTAGSRSGRTLAGFRRLEEPPDESSPALLVIDRGGARTARATAKLEHWPKRSALSTDERFYVGAASLDDVTLVMPYDLARSAPEASWKTTLFVQAIGLSPDGRHVALGGERVAIHDRAGGALVQTLLPQALNVAALVYADRDTLVAATESDGLQVWSAGRGALVRTLHPGEKGQPQGSGDTAYSVAVSPDGALVASGHRRGGVKLWDLASGRELASVAGHRGLVLAVAFSADGKRLASGDEHGQVRVWPLVPR